MSHRGELLAECYAAAARGHPCIGRRLTLLVLAEWRDVPCYTEGLCPMDRTMLRVEWSKTVQ